MKKQLFLIVILALFAGISSVNAQCVGNGFNPSAGTPYVYEVTVPPGNGYLGGLNGTYTWYVTQDVNLLNAGAIILPGPSFSVNVGAGLSTYNSVVGTTFQLSLTWTAAAVLSPNPFFLVLKYSEPNSNAAEPGGCSGTNIRVWQINPINTFLLAITGSTPTGVQFDPANQCAAPVTGAVVTPGAPTTVAYTYGTNTLYYRVLASGASGVWTPSVLLPALANLGQNYTGVDWTDDLTGLGTWNAFNVPSPIGNTTGGSFSSTATANITDPAAGTPILVRIQISNVNYETLADQPILVGIDGLLPTGMSDIWGGAGPIPDPCAQADPFAKTATYTILARPNVNAVTGTFIQKLP
jgi:hypothetical protein